MGVVSVLGSVAALLAFLGLRVDERWRLALSFAVFTEPVFEFGL